MLILAIYLFLKKLTNISQKNENMNYRDEFFQLIFQVGVGVFFLYLCALLND